MNALILFSNSNLTGAAPFNGIPEHELFHSDMQRGKQSVCDSVSFLKLIKRKHATMYQENEKSLSHSIIAVNTSNEHSGSASGIDRIPVFLCHHQLNCTSQLVSLVPIGWCYGSNLPFGSFGTNK